VATVSGGLKLFLKKLKIFLDIEKLRLYSCFERLAHFIKKIKGKKMQIQFNQQISPNFENTYRYFAKDLATGECLGFIQLRAPRIAANCEAQSSNIILSNKGQDLMTKILDQSKAQGFDIHAFLNQFTTNIKAYSWNGKKGKAQILELNA
jgi:hypothetical protein